MAGFGDARAQVGACLQPLGSSLLLDHRGSFCLIYFILIWWESQQPGESGGLLRSAAQALRVRCRLYQLTPSPLAGRTGAASRNRGFLEGRSRRGARHLGRRCVGAGESAGKIKKELLNNHFVFSSAEHSLLGINRQHQFCSDTLAFLFIYSLALFQVGSRTQAVSARSPSRFGSVLRGRVSVRRMLGMHTPSGWMLVCVCCTVIKLRGYTALFIRKQLSKHKLINHSCLPVRSMIPEIFNLKIFPF